MYKLTEEKKKMLKELIKVNEELKNPTVVAKFYNSKGQTIDITTGLPDSDPNPIHHTLYWGLWTKDQVEDIAQELKLKTAIMALN